MKKFITVFSVVSLFVGVALTLGWPYLDMGFSSSANYTQRDKREYDYYTPELLKRMPRISDNYEFSYSNISGPQAFVYGIQFNGTNDASRIREYLISEGYELQSYLNGRGSRTKRGVRAYSPAWSEPPTRNPVAIPYFRSFFYHCHTSDSIKAFSTLIV